MTENYQICSTYTKYKIIYTTETIYVKANKNCHLIKICILPVRNNIPFSFNY